MSTTFPHPAALVTDRPGGAARPTVALVAHAVHDEGGMERAYAELIRRIHERYRVVVVSCELAPSLRPLVDWRRVRVPRRPFPLRFVLFFALGGLRLRRLRPDLVHTLGAIVPNRSDAAEVQFCHAGFLAATGRLSPAHSPPFRRLNTSITRLLSLAAERWSYRPSRLRAFVAVSSGIAAELAEHFPGIPVTVAPNGVDLDRYRSDAATRHRIRVAEGVSDDAVIALFVGGDWDRKGLPVVLEALRHAQDVQLWVVGRGEESRAAAVARDLGVRGRVRFFGTRTDTAQFYAAADIFCLPSLYEAFPLVALEAAASGLPVVATPVHGVTELIGKDEAGLLVERSAAAVGDALNRLADDPGLRARLGSAAQQRVAGHTWDAAAGITVTLYDELLEHAKRVQKA